MKNTNQWFGRRHDRCLQLAAATMVLLLLHAAAAGLVVAQDVPEAAPQAPAPGIPASDEASAPSAMPVESEVATSDAAEGSANAPEAQSRVQPLPAATAVSAQTSVGVVAGLVVPLRIAGVRSSEQDNRNGVISATVARDVRRGSTLVIRSGTPAMVRIRADKRSSVGEPGIIRFLPVSTSAVDGSPIALTGEHTVVGENKRGVALGVSLGLTLGSLFILWPTMFVMMVKGGEAKSDAGLVIDSVTA